MLKIVSHNINGIRAFSKNKKFNKLFNLNADIYCLQEVKCGDYDVIRECLDNSKFKGWHSFTKYSKFKKGYAGVCFVTRPGLEIINESSPEDDMMILENVSGYGMGRVATLELKDFYIINVYSINSGNKEQDRINFDRNLITYLNSLDKPFVLCGDLNVCSTKLDYWGDYAKAINLSPGLMEFEINDFKNLINETNSVDAFRYLYPDKREYSWVSTMVMPRVLENIKNYGWRLDYFIVNNEISNKIIDTKIHNEINWQKYDHMPIELTLDYDYDTELAR